MTGKPVFSDLVKRKTSLPVAVTLAAGGEDARRLAALLPAPTSTPASSPPPQI